MLTQTQENATAVKRLLIRTASVLDEETKLIGADPRANISELSTRKNRLLFELSTAMREFTGGKLHLDLANELEALKLSAMANERALSVNIKASQDVVAILGRMANDDLNDGTYSSTNI